MNTNFERHKLLRFIKSQGQVYTFVAYGQNQFGEPSGIKTSLDIPGVYHETQGYVSGSASDGSNIKTKPNSLIMCLSEDCVGLSRNMVTTIGDKRYKVVDLRNVNNLDVACDISLEVILE